MTKYTVSVKLIIEATNEEEARKDAVAIIESPSFPGGDYLSKDEYTIVNISAPYEKIGPSHPSYQAMMMHRAAKLYFCDSVDHNDETGCSNPDCWKYNND